MHRKIIALILPILFLATACDSEKLCKRFETGYNWGTAVAYPLLDVIPGAATKLEPIKAGLEMVHASLASLCADGARNVDPERVAELVAQGARLVSDLARLYGNYAPAARGGDGPEWAKVSVEMAKLEADAAKAGAKARARKLER